MNVASLELCKEYMKLIIIAFVGALIMPYISFVITMWLFELHTKLSKGVKCS